MQNKPREDKASLNRSRAVGIAALEESRKRWLIASSVERIVASTTTSSGRILTIGEGLDHLELDACREVVLLRPPEKIPRSLPERARAEPWLDPWRLPFATNSFACVIALDELSRVPPEQHDLFVGELARVAEDAVLVLSPFASEEVDAVLRRMERLYRTAFGPGRAPFAYPVENGLPNLEHMQASLSLKFPHVLTQPVAGLWRWQIVESLSSLPGEYGSPPAGAGPTVPLPSVAPGAVDSAPYRRLVVASRAELRDQRARAASQAEAVEDLLATLQIFPYGATDRFDRVLSDVVARVEQGLSRAAEHALHEKERTQAELERLVRELVDDLDEAERECTHLRAESERLRAERESVEAALSQQIANLQHWIQVIESTRGWKLLTVYRRWRDWILRRAR